MTDAMKKLVVFPFFAAVVLFAAAAPGQVLTAEEVTAVMESPAVKQAFSDCAATMPHPASIDFVLIIGLDGHASLSETQPAVEAELYLCFQNAAKQIKLKETGKKFEITYPMEFAPYAAAPMHPPETAASGGGVVVLPTTPHPPASIQPQPATGGSGWSDPKWEAEYRKGRGMVIAGAVLMGGGGLVFVGSLIGLAVAAAECSISNSLFGTGSCDVPTIIPVMFFGGLAVLVTGIVLLAVGVKKKRRAGRMRYGYLLPGVGLSPLTDGEGAMTTLAWRF